MFYCMFYFTCDRSFNNQSRSVDAQFTEGLVNSCERRSLRFVEVERLSTGVMKHVLTKLLSHDGVLVVLCRHTSTSLTAKLQRDTFLANKNSNA